MANKITDIKRIVWEYIEKIVNTGNVNLIPEYVSEDYTEVFQGKTYPMGIEGAKEQELGVRQTYPDLHITIDK